MISCSCLNCKKKNEVPHSMRRIYRFCNCDKDSCQFKLRIYICEISNIVFIYNSGEHKGRITKIKETRGINKRIKKIEEIIVVNKDIIPSQVHELLLNQHKLPVNIIPSLKQMIWKRIIPFSSILIF